MSNLENLVLGTAQIGMPYGIANSKASYSEKTAVKILQTAWENGIKTYDTAQSYGQSEKIIGLTFKTIRDISDLKIITKIDAKSENLINTNLISAVQKSLTRLETNTLWGLLLHDEKNIDLWQTGLKEKLSFLKQNLLVKNIGVSVYSVDIGLQAMDLEEVDFIQIPVNVFDRRFIRKGFPELAVNRGKTIFVRSVYLQGLAIMNQSAVPRSIPSAESAVKCLTKFSEENKISPKQFSIDFVKTYFPNAKIIIGADSEDQVIDNCRIFTQPQSGIKTAQKWNEMWPTDVNGLIDPRTWPSKPNKKQ